MSSGEGVCCIYNLLDKERVAWAFFTLNQEALKTAFMLQEPSKTVVEATIPDTAVIRLAKEKFAFQHDAYLKSVMFIGDANHLLSPFEYVGANLALKDGWDLAEQICRNTSMDAVVSAYDHLSIVRFEEVFNFSHERIGFGHFTGKKWTLYKYGMAAQRAFKQVH